METKQSFSTSEVAKYCHVTADTIRKWAEAGRIKVFKTPGGHRRIRREDLVKFLRENSIPVHGDLSNTGMKILVVDSERPVITMVRRFLERAPSAFLIEAAHDAFDAGFQVATFRPDILFLDMGLPGIDSMEMCRRLRELPEFVNLQIIATFAQDHEDATLRALENGARATLRKSFTPDDLRRALAKVGVEVI